MEYPKNQNVVDVVHNPIATVVGEKKPELPTENIHLAELRKGTSVFSRHIQAFPIEKQEIFANEVIAPDALDHGVDLDAERTPEEMAALLKAVNEFIAEDSRDARRILSQKLRKLIRD